MTVSRHFPATLRLPATLRALTGLLGLAVLSLPLAAEAGSKRQRCWENDTGRVVCRQVSTDRRDASEREYDRARANAYDPGGSYSDYPDWARYALSPKGMR